MNVLVAYATNSSGTLVSSVIVANKLITANHTVAHKDIRTVRPDELASYDLIVFGSPSWDYKSKEGRLEGQPHEFFRKFMSDAKDLKLPDKRFAIFGLGDTAYINFCGAVDHLLKFVEGMGGKLVIDPLRIDGFYFNQPENEKKVMTWAEKLKSALV